MAQCSTYISEYRNSHNETLEQKRLDFINMLILEHSPSFSFTPRSTPTMENNWLTRSPFFLAGYYFIRSNCYFSLGLIQLSSPNHAIEFIISWYLGISLFPGPVSYFSLAAIGLRMDPISVRPRLLKDRNLGPFAVLSLLIGFFY